MLILFYIILNYILFYIKNKLEHYKTIMSEVFANNEHRVLAGGAAPPTNNKASPIERFLALMLIVLIAALGGFIVKIISKG